MNYLLNSSYGASYEHSFLLGFGNERLIHGRLVSGARKGATDVDDVDAGVGEGADVAEIRATVPADFDIWFNRADERDFLDLEHVNIAALMTEVTSKNHYMVDVCDEIFDLAWESAFQQSETDFNTGGVELGREASEIVVDFGMHDAK